MSWLRTAGRLGNVRPAGPLGAILLAGAVLTGCQAQIDAAGEPGDTRVLVSRSSTALTVSAPEWRPPRTLVYLCPTAPTKTVAGLVDAGTITLPADCVAYGLIDTSRGLDTVLGYGTIDAARRPAFDSAPEWHLVLIGIRDGAADRVFRTAISPVQIDPSLTPGPPQSVPSEPVAPSGSPSSSASPNGAAGSASGSASSSVAGVWA
ncbi:MAG: hypothetical protein QOF11_228 [Chloroflexota bacterium]|jgi:hypothetical protein|nr:hypothetical protein [Chloroflexota bacterium]